MPRWRAAAGTALEVEAVDGRRFWSPRRSRARPRSSQVDEGCARWRWARARWRPPRRANPRAGGGHRVGVPPLEPPTEHAQDGVDSRSRRARHRLPLTLGHVLDALGEEQRNRELDSTAATTLGHVALAAGAPISVRTLIIAASAPLAAKSVCGERELPAAAWTRPASADLWKERLCCCGTRCAPSGGSSPAQRPISIPPRSLSVKLHDKAVDRGRQRLEQPCEHRLSLTGRGRGRPAHDALQRAFSFAARLESSTAREESAAGAEFSSRAAQRGAPG